MFQLYSGREAKATTMFSQLYLFILVGFQFLELVCYLILYRYISKHNQEMADNNIISTDLLSSRRRINVLSLYAQICGFVTEVVYFIILLITKVLGRSHLIPNTREYSNVAVIVLFGTNSTVIILASSELRKKFFELFKR